MGCAVWGLDQWSKHRAWSWRFPPLAVALGLYLPLELSAPVAFGGVLHFLLLGRRSSGDSSASASASRNALLVSAGLITGEALMGVLLAAVLIALYVAFRIYS